MDYESSVRAESLVDPEVIYVVSRMSFGRRIELMRLVREIAMKLEFYSAGKSDTDKMEVALLAAQIDRLYVSWGLHQIEGLSIDGQAATPDLLASAGPEELFHEALLLVRDQCGLTEKERKN